jgi:hypothetical protein
MGRQPSAPKKLKNGFYIEVRNKGSKSGVIIGRNTKDLMMRAIKEYEKTKDVIILGNSENGKWVKKSEEKEAS